MASGNWYFESKSTAKRQLSKHALKRGCQRGISELSVPLITAYGEKEHDGKGGIRYLMTSAAITNLRRVVGCTQQVDALQNMYAVVSSDGSTVITVGHRFN